MCQKQYMVVLISDSTKYRTCVVHHSFLLLFHSVAICESKEKFTLLNKTKDKLKEIAQIRAQYSVDVAVQLLQRIFGSRSIADQKLTVQQPRPIPNLKLKKGAEQFNWNGTLRKIGFVEVLLEMVVFASHVCSSNLGYHSRGRREVART